MLNIDSRTLDNYGDDPAPSFATDAEIEMAERLRHQLEERYLNPPSAKITPRPRNGDKR